MIDLLDWNLLVAGLVIYALLTYRIHVQRWSKKRFAGPMHLPGFGCLLHPKLIHAKLTTMGQPYFMRMGKVCKAFGVDGTCEGTGGIQNFLLTTNLSVAKDILASPDICARFPSHPRYKEHTYYKELGLIFNTGESWKEMRKFALKTLKEFGFGELKASEAFLQEELADFIEFMDKDRLKNEMNEVHMHGYFKIPTFNILWRVMSGTRFKYDDPEIKRIIKCIDESAKIEIGMDLEWAYPILRYIPGMSNSRSQGHKIVDCQNFFVKILHEKRALGQYKISQGNYIDYFLKKIDDEKDNPNTWYTDENFVICCLDLMYGGLDTTASAIEFAVLHMVANQDKQKKVHEEIDRVIGMNRIPNVYDRNNLPYVSATLIEVFRHSDIIPVLSRASICDTYIQGRFIPKDTGCGILFPLIHKDPTLFPEPYKFIPERFLDENMNIVNDDKVTAFGGGKRVCLGYTMGKVMLTTFFTRVMQRYKIVPSPVHPELDTIPDYAIANSVKPFYCCIKMREEEES